MLFWNYEIFYDVGWWRICCVISEIQRIIREYAFPLFVTKKQTNQQRSRVLYRVTVACVCYEIRGYGFSRICFASTTVLNKFSLYSDVIRSRADQAKTGCGCSFTAGKRRFRLQHGAFGRVDRSLKIPSPPPSHLHPSTDERAHSCIFRGVTSHGGNDGGGVVEYFRTLTALGNLFRYSCWPQNDVIYSFYIGTK